MWSVLLRFAPYLAAVCVAGVVAWGIYHKGVTDERTKWKLRWAEMEAQQAKYAAAQQAKLNAALLKGQQKQSEVRERFEHHEAPDVESCTDPDWVLGINHLAEDANAP